VAGELRDRRQLGVFFFFFHVTNDLRRRTGYARTRHNQTVLREIERNRM